MDPDSLENLYYGIAALVVAILTVNGWRQGLGRQLTMLAAIGGAYAVAYFYGGTAAHWFDSLNFPAPVTRVIGSAAAGTLTYVIVSILGRLLFKRTADKKEGRATWGALGAFIGLCFGCVLFLASSELIRLAGALIDTTAEASPKIEAAPAAKQEHPLLAGISALSNSLNNGGIGDLLRKVDPVPPKVFTVVNNIGHLISSPEAGSRFMSDPAIQELVRNPKVIALREDPEVARLIASKDIIKLLHNEKLISVANDPEITEKLKQVEFTKTLDHALRQPQSAAPSPLPPIQPSPR